MLRLARLIDALNARIGAVLAWLVVALALVQFAVVIGRYAFGLGSVMVQEALVYMFASLFMLTAGDVLRRDGHVRVDIWHRGASPRAKIVVDVVGTVVFLWPLAAVVLWQGFPYVAKSVAVREGSSDIAGIPAVWLLKCEILAFAALLALQGAAVVIRGIAALAGAPREEPDGRSAG